MCAVTPFQFKGILEWPFLYIGSDLVLMTSYFGYSREVCTAFFKVVPVWRLTSGWLQGDLKSVGLGNLRALGCGAASRWRFVYACETNKSTSVSMRGIMSLLEPLVGSVERSTNT